MKKFLVVQAIVAFVALVSYGIYAFAAEIYDEGYGHEITKDQYKWVAYWSTRSQTVTDKAKLFLADNKISISEYSQLEEAFNDTERYMTRLETEKVLNGK